MWLAPVKYYSWKVSLNNNIFGVPMGKSHIINELKYGDYIVFFVLNPINGILGLAKVVSSPFIDNETHYQKNKSEFIKYPYRVKIDLKKENIRSPKNSIKLYEVLGYKNLEKGYTIEPYLRNIILMELNDSDSKLILELFKE